MLRSITFKNKQTNTINKKRTQSIWGIDKFICTNKPKITGLAELFIQMV